MLTLKKEDKLKFVENSIEILKNKNCEKQCILREYLNKLALAILRNNPYDEMFYIIYCYTHYTIHAIKDGSIFIEFSTELKDMGNNNKKLVEQIIGTFKMLTVDFRDNIEEDYTGEFSISIQQGVFDFGVMIFAQIISRDEFLYNEYMEIIHMKNGGKDENIN